MSVARGRAEAWWTTALSERHWLVSGRSDVAMSGRWRRWHVGASGLHWRGWSHRRGAWKAIGTHWRRAEVRVARRTRSAGHLVTGLLLSPVLGDRLIAVAWVVAVLRRRITHRLLVLPRASHGLHWLHGHCVGHVRRSWLLRSTLWMAVVLLMRRGLRRDSRALRLVSRGRTLGLKRPCTRVVRCTGWGPQVGPSMSSATLRLRGSIWLRSGRGCRGGCCTGLRGRSGCIRGGSRAWRRRAGTLE